jgi:trehalose 6-phosphate phosphatase
MLAVMTPVEPERAHRDRAVEAFRPYLGGALIACDYDGTLAPIVGDPTTAVPAPGAIAALADLAARCRRVAVITGRPADVAVDLGGLDAVPGLVVLGHYGVQRWTGGTLQTPRPSPKLDDLGVELEELVNRAGEGVRLERKGLSMAVHTRAATDPAAALDALRPEIERAAQQHELEIVPGRFVLEVRAPGLDKGQALAGLLEETAAAAAAFIGDDVGDLPAFAELRRRSEAGMPTLGVCSESAETPPSLRPWCDISVDGPPGVVSLLQDVMA